MFCPIRRVLKGFYKCFVENPNSTTNFWSQFKYFQIITFITAFSFAVEIFWRKVLLQSGSDKISFPMKLRCSERGGLINRNGLIVNYRSKIMDDLNITSGQKKLEKTISCGDSESVNSDDSSSPKSIDSEYSFDTTFSSLEDDQGQYGSDDSRVSSRLSRQSSIVDGLLTEIYDRYHHGSRSGDSDNVTECSTTSFYSGSFELDERTQRWTRSQLNGKGTFILMLILNRLAHLVYFS